MKKIFSVFFSHLILVIFSLVFVARAQAAHYMACGQKSDAENTSTNFGDYSNLDGRALYAFSSESDDYNGPVGGNWHMKIFQTTSLPKDSEGWLLRDASIVSKSNNVNGETNLVISFKSNNDLSIKSIEFLDIYSEVVQMKLKKPNGSIDEYSCLTTVL